MINSSITLSTPNGELTKTVVRAFDIPGQGVLVQTGREADDHDLWMLNSQQAKYVGVLNEAALKHLRRAKNLALDCASGVFEDLHKSFSQMTLTGRVTTFADSETKFQAAY